MNKKSYNRFIKRIYDYRLKFSMIKFVEENKEELKKNNFEEVLFKLLFEKEKWLYEDEVYILVAMLKAMDISIADILKRRRKGMFISRRSLHSKFLIEMVEISLKYQEPNEHLYQFVKNERKGKPRKK